MMLDGLRKKFDGHVKKPFWNGARLIRQIIRHLETIERRSHTMAVIERERYVRDIQADRRYDTPGRIIRQGFKVYSQNDEDGIIQEIFRRIGTTNKTFVKFGVEGRLKNNSLKLLLEGWSGLWLEGSPEHVETIRGRFTDLLAENRLKVREAFIDRDNINVLIGEHYQGEIDMISIDIDGNAIYILEALEVVNPRLVVIEYNGKFPPSMSVAQEYNPTHRWHGTDYGGSSLTAITKVAAKKGYSLVGCNVTGVNSFFVRNDLLVGSSPALDQPQVLPDQHRFCQNTSPDNHYELARYFLWQTYISGHGSAWGPYLQFSRGHTNARCRLAQDHRTNYRNYRQDRHEPYPENSAFHLRHGAGFRRQAVGDDAPLLRDVRHQAHQA